MRTRIAAVSVLLAAAGCSAVKLPPERTFALRAPSPPAGAAAAPTLRVDELLVASGVDRDRPMVRRGVVVEMRDGDRWSCPLDRLLTDAFVLGLQRAGVAGLVKGPYDAGGEDLVLRGRFTEFAAVEGDGSLSAEVAGEIWLEAAGVRRWTAALAASEPIADRDTAAIVDALSRALDAMIAATADRVRSAGGP